MEYSETQYRRVARHLDGESVELTADERALAEEMQQLQGTVAGELDVAVPGSALRSARWRLRSELTTDRKPARRWARWVAAASVAASVALAVSVWMTASPDAPVGGGESRPVAVNEEQLYEDVVAATSDESLAADIELVTDDVAELESEMLASVDVGVGLFADTDAAIDAADDQLDEIDAYDPFEGLGG
jgi:hypothetical protein